MSLRDRREALGLSQAEVASRAGTTQATYGSIESGRTQIPSVDLRRSISRVLGISHIQFLVETGQLADWELPGFDVNGEPEDSRLESLVHLVRTVDLSKEGRGATLSSILQFWAREDSPSEP